MFSWLAFQLHLYSIALGLDWTEWDVERGFVRNLVV